MCPTFRRHGCGHRVNDAVRHQHIVVDVEQPLVAAFEPRAVRLVVAGMAGRVSMTWSQHGNFQSECEGSTGDANMRLLCTLGPTSRDLRAADSDGTDRMKLRLKSLRRLCCPVNMRACVLLHSELLLCTQNRMLQPLGPPLLRLHSNPGRCQGQHQEAQSTLRRGGLCRRRGHHAGEHSGK